MRTVYMERIEGVGTVAKHYVSNSGVAFVYVYPMISAVTLYTREFQIDVGRREETLSFLVFRRNGDVSASFISKYGCHRYVDTAGNRKHVERMWGWPAIAFNSYTAEKLPQTNLV